MDCSTPGFPAHHQLPELTQTHVNVVISIGAAIFRHPGSKIPFTDNLEANILYWRRKWQLAPVLLPGKFHGLRSLVGYSLWGCKELDTTERLHFHALEKEMATHSSVLALRIPGTGKPGWAAVYGVAQSWTRLKRFHFHALEKEMATYSSILAWEIPWTEEPVGLQSMGSQKNQTQLDN